MMQVYIGYIMTDYSRPLYMSRDRKRVEKELERFDKKGYETWIMGYDLGKDGLVELECS